MPRKRRDSDSEESDSESSGSESESDSSGSESESGSSGSESGSSSSGSDSDSDSSEDEEEKILEALKDAGVKKYAKAFSKAGIDTIKAAKKVDSKKLAKMGIEGSDKKKVLKALSAIDSDSGSSSEDSSSDSEDEEDRVLGVLKKHSELKKYVRNFEKADIDTMKAAKKLDDKKLKKMGIDSASHRKKIIKEFDKAKGEVEDDEKVIAKVMKGINMKKHMKALQKGKVTDLGDAYKLDDKKLKKIGIDSSADRKKIVKAFKEHKKEHGDEDEEAEVVRKLLSKAGMKKYYPLFKKKEIDTVEKAKGLQHKDLREMGIHLYRERRDIIEEFEKYNGEDLPSTSSGSSSSGDGVNMVHEVLRQQYMSRHIPDFDRMGITTLRQARKLTQTQLRSMGVALYLQRERLINAFADYRPKNKAIMKLLIDCNLASHAREFEKLIDVEDAKNLTHSDLRAMGINLYGQRERLMRAFMEYKKKK